jgi:hypothetical protein
MRLCTSAGVATVEYIQNFLWAAFCCEDARWGIPVAALIRGDPRIWRFDNRERQHARCLQTRRVPAC